MRISDWSSDVCSSDLKNFRALILVDEDMARVELFELRHQEVDQHRLTAARWTNDHRMAKVCRMEIEVIGAASACLQQGDRRTTMIAVLMSCRERRDERERRQIIIRDRRGGRHPSEDADQKGPE